MRVLCEASLVSINGVLEDNSQPLRNAGSWLCLIYLRDLWPPRPELGAHPSHALIWWPQGWEQEVQRHPPLRVQASVPSLVLHLWFCRNQSTVSQSSKATPDIC